MLFLNAQSFNPGSRHCVHVPKLFRTETLVTIIAEISGTDPSLIGNASLKRCNYLHGYPTVTWLAAKTHRSMSEAKMVIRSLPVRIPDDFAQMPMTALRFLSFLNAIHGDPSILIYETHGMEPRGRYLLHE